MYIEVHRSWGIPFNRYMILFMTTVSILAISTEFVLSLGFQLSVLITLSIFIVSNKISHFSYVSDLKVGIVANTVAGVLLKLRRIETNTLGIVHNLVVAPFAFLIYELSLVKVVLLPFSEMLVRVIGLMGEGITELVVLYLSATTDLRFLNNLIFFICLIYTSYLISSAFMEKDDIVRVGYLLSDSERVHFTSA